MERDGGGRSTKGRSAHTPRGTQRTFRAALLTRHIWPWSLPPQLGHRPCSSAPGPWCPDRHANRLVGCTELAPAGGRGGCTYAEGRQGWNRRVSAGQLQISVRSEGRAGAHHRLDLDESSTWSLSRRPRPARDEGRAEVGVGVGPS